MKGYERKMSDKVIMGFEFEDEVSYKLAKSELDKILKIKENYSVKSSKNLLEFYNRLIDETIFKTPVGMEYLRNIQKELYAKKDIDKQNIRNIPAIIYEEKGKDSASGNHIRPVNTSSSVKGSKKTGKYKDLYIRMLIINVVLVVTIAVMFIITKHSEKYDLDYYRESIENDYINWENNLKEREAALEEQENSK